MNIGQAEQCCQGPAGKDLAGRRFTPPPVSSAFRGRVASLAAPSASVALILAAVAHVKKKSNTSVECRLWCSAKLKIPRALATLAGRPNARTPDPLMTTCWPAAAAAAGGNSLSLSPSSSTAFPAASPCKIRWECDKPRVWSHRGGRELGRGMERWGVSEDWCNAVLRLGWAGDVTLSRRPSAKVSSAKVFFPLNCSRHRRCFSPYPARRGSDMHALSLSQQPRGSQAAPGPHRRR